MTKDIVCGMAGKFEVTATYKGKTYYFCSHVCQETFKKTPEQFIVR